MITIRKNQKEILEAAGCEMGDDGFYYRDGEKVGFVISVSAGDQVRIDMAQIAAQELKRDRHGCICRDPCTDRLGRTDGIPDRMGKPV